jgi:hypothetical protein
VGVTFGQLLRRAAPAPAAPSSSPALPAAPVDGSAPDCVEAQNHEQQPERARTARAQKLVGEALEAQRQRLAEVRFTAHADRYRHWHAAEREKIKQRVMGLLRDYGPEEKTLIGKQAIVLWFASMGIGNRLGKGATWGCISGWRKRLGCPIWRGRGPKSPPWTTDVLLRAWLLSLFSTDNAGGPRILRRFWATGLRDPADWLQDCARPGAEPAPRA